MPMLPGNDIPIELINLALLAVISIPFVLAISIYCAARYLVRPLWAIQYQLKHGSHEGANTTPGALPQSAPEDRARARISLSQFAR
jgi:hypothetical protein